jgi:plasmid maintenance system antidote protein VapI
MWIGLQQDFDLWDAHQARGKEYDCIKRVTTPRPHNLMLRADEQDT